MTKLIVAKKMDLIMSVQNVRNNISIDSQQQLVSLNYNFIDLNHQSFYKLLKYLSEFLHYKTAHLFVKRSSLLTLKYSYPHPSRLPGSSEVKIAPKIMKNLFEGEGMRIINSKDPIRKYFHFIDKKNDSVLLLFPLKNDDIQLGLIIFSRFTDDSFRDFDYSKVKSILFQLYFLLYTSLLMDKEVRKSKLIENINNICHTLESFINENELFESLVRCIQKNLKYDHVGLYLVDKKKEKDCIKSYSWKL